MLDVGERIRMAICIGELPTSWRSWHVGPTPRELRRPTGKPSEGVTFDGLHDPVRPQFDVVHVDLSQRWLPHRGGRYSAWSAVVRLLNDPPVVGEALEHLKGVRRKPERRSLVGIDDADRQEMSRRQFVPAACFDMHGDDVLGDRYDAAQDEQLCAQELLTMLTSHDLPNRHDGPSGMAHFRPDRYRRSLGQFRVPPDAHVPVRVAVDVHYPVRIDEVRPARKAQRLPAGYGKVRWS
jgi:hypothetical protein